MEIKNVAVIGTGTMGADIAYILFKEGYGVNLWDDFQNCLQGAYDRIVKEAKGKDISKLKKASSLEDAVSDVDLVIEAIIENKEIKTNLFKKLDEVTRKDTILATNTSTLSITELGKETNRPDKVIGLHYFNPATMLRLVEIVMGSTSEETYSTCKSFVDKIKKVGVRVKDSPGFVVNRILIPMMNNSMYSLKEQLEVDKKQISWKNVAFLARDIDAAIKNEKYMLAGPFEVADLVGLETARNASVEMWNRFEKDPKYQPSDLIDYYVNRKLLGWKSNVGFYAYADKQNIIDMVLSEYKIQQSPAIFDHRKVTFPMINDSQFVLYENLVEDPSVIDKAMKAGCKWAKGPVELLQQYGKQNVGDFLKELYEKTGNPRYKPCPLLV